MKIQNKLTFPLLFIAILVASISFAQKSVINPPEKKYYNIGLSYNMADFDTKTIFPKKDSLYGFSVMYWNGISRQLDYSLRFNGLFSNKNVNNAISSNRMSPEFEASVHAKALPDEKPFNPFLTAGIGIGNYRKSNWEPYLPLGVGLQYNIKSELYCLLQANYRYSFNQNDLPNNLFYSLGITRSLWGNKKAVPSKIIDTDMDGLPDELDACPTVAGSAASQGCPDRDADGIADKDDACPDVPGIALLKGCPDKDGDGIADDMDKCPDVKGVAKYNGCPIPDTDKDGINDDEDKCPTVPGVAAYNGCPIPDSDGDGINDAEDRCPNLAGTKENNGCPAISEEIKKKTSIAAKNILFITGSAKLQKSSFKGLNDVAKIIAENPGMLIVIEGHTDNTGTDEKNQVLSEARAQSVKEYLSSRGVDVAHINSNGFGSSRPIADNQTATGRQKNRRVELILSY